MVAVSYTFFMLRSVVDVYTPLNNTQYLTRWERLMQHSLLAQLGRGRYIVNARYRSGDNKRLSLNGRRWIVNMHWRAVKWNKRRRTKNNRDRREIGDRHLHNRRASGGMVVMLFAWGTSFFQPLKNFGDGSEIELQGAGLNSGVTHGVIMWATSETLR
jgi:hypothetical protein